jgi:hypothetical protein
MLKLLGLTIKAGLRELSFQDAQINSLASTIKSVLYNSSIQAACQSRGMVLRPSGRAR